MNIDASYGGCFLTAWPETIFVEPLVSICTLEPVNDLSFCVTSLLRACNEAAPDIITTVPDAFHLAFMNVYTLSSQCAVC
jgi:hypothetical protein